MKLTRKWFFRIIFIVPATFSLFLFTKSLAEFLKWKNRKAEWYEKIGDEKYNLGKYGEALSNYLKSESLDPKNASIYRKIGKIYLEKGILNEEKDFLGAKKSLEKSIELDSKNEESFKLLSETYYLLGEKELSVDILDRFDGEKSKDFEAFAGKMNLLVLDPDKFSGFEKASEFFSSALSKDPGNIDLMIYLAASRAPIRLVETKDLVEKIIETDKTQKTEAFSKAIKIRNAIALFDASDPLIKNYQYGIAFYESGFFKTSLFFLNEANLIDPTYAPAFFLKGKVYLDLKDYTSAKSSFETVIKLQPFNSEAIYYLAKTLTFFENPEESIEYFDLAIKKNYYSEDLFFDYGETLLKLNIKSKAKEKFQEALFTNPAHIKARERLLKIYIEEENFSEVEKLIEDARKIYFEEEYPFGDFLYLIYSSSKENLLEDGEKAAQSLIEKSEKSEFLRLKLSDIYYYKGKIEKALGKTKEAQKSFLNALDYDLRGEISELVVLELENESLEPERKSFWWWLKEIQ